jgi:hypothetical protein
MERFWDAVELYCWWHMNYPQWKAVRKYATALTKKRGTAHQRRG